MGSVFDAVGDVLGDIVEFAVDDILEPIFEVVGDVVEGMGDDPLGTILTIASFVPGPHQVFVMVAKTALAVSRGDLIGAALNVAGYYAMPYVDAWVADAVGVSTALDVGVGAGELIEIAAPTFTETVIASAVKGLITPTISGLASGADINDITKAAFIGAATSGGTAALTYNFGDDVDSSDFSDEELSVEYKEYKTTVDAIGEGISDLAEGFKDLPPVIQEMIKNTTASAVTAAISGGDVDLADILPAALAKAATKVFFTEGIIKDAYSTIEDPVERRVFIDKLALLDRSLDAAITSSFAGADPVAAFNDVVLQDQLLESSKEIVKFLDSADISTLFENRDTASEALLEEEKSIKDEQDALSEERLAFDELTNDLEDSPLRKLHNGENDLASFSLDIVKAKVERANELNDARIVKAKDPVFHYDYGEDEGGITKTLVVDKPGVGGSFELVDQGDGDWQEEWVSTGDVTSPMSAEQTTLIKEINTWVKENDRLLPAYKTKREELEAAYATYQTKVTALNTRIEEYNTGYLGDAITSADEAITLATNDVVSDWGAEVVVNNMNPDFNAEEYGQLHGVPSEATGDDPDEVGIAWKDGSDANLSPHQHWLATGKTNTFSREQNNQQVTETILNSIPPNILQDLTSIAALRYKNDPDYAEAKTKSEIAALYTKHQNEVLNSYIGDVQSRIDPSLNTAASELTPEMITAAGTAAFNAIETDYGPTDIALEEKYTPVVYGGGNLSPSGLAQLKAEGKLRYYPSVALGIQPDGSYNFSLPVWGAPLPESPLSTPGATVFNPETNTLETTPDNSDLNWSSVADTPEDKVKSFAGNPLKYPFMAAKVTLDGAKWLAGAAKDNWISILTGFSELFPDDTKKEANLKLIKDFFGIGKFKEEYDGEEGVEYYIKDSIRDAKIVSEAEQMLAALQKIPSENRPLILTGEYLASLPMGDDPSDLASMAGSLQLSLKKEVSEWEKLEQERYDLAKSLDSGYRPPDGPWSTTGLAKGLQLHELKDVDFDLYLGEVERLGRTLPPEDMKKLTSTERTVIDLATNLSDATRSNKGSWDNPIRNDAQLEDYNLHKDLAYAAITAGGDLLQATAGMFQFLNIYTGKGTGTKTNPYTGDPYPADEMRAQVEELARIAASTGSKGLKAGIDNFNKLASGGSGGVSGAFGAYGKALATEPYAFLVGKLLPEIITELPQLAASVGTGGATYAVTLALAKAASKTAAKRIAGKTAGTAAFSVDRLGSGAETFGATFESHFAEIYNTAIGAEFSETEALQKAYEGASTTGATGALIEFGLGNLDPTSTFAKKLFNNTGVESTSENIKKFFTAVAAEGLGESTEEMTTEFMLGRFLGEIDPTVFEEGGSFYDFSGRVARAGIEAALLGAGSVTPFAALNLGMEAGGADIGGGGADIGGGGASLGFDLNYSGLGDVDYSESMSNFITQNNPTISKAVSEADSDDPGVRAKAKDTLEGLFDYNVLSDTQNYTDLEFSTDADGAYFYNTATEVLNTAFPDEYNTSEEVGGYFSDISADLGVSYDPSDSDILQLTGPGTTLDTTEAITGIINENALTIPEIQQVGADMGYTFSDGMDYGEIPGIGVGTPEEQAAAVASLQENIGASQFTKQNLIDIFGADLASTGSDLGFVGQGDLGSDYNLTQTEAAEELYGLLGVTSEEVIAQFGAQGYNKPDDPEGAAAFDAEVAKYTGTASTLDPEYQKTTYGNIVSDLDPRYIKESEARQAYLDLGVTNPTQADIDRFIGLGSEDELSTNITSYLPVANYNSAQAAQQAAAEQAAAAQQAAQEAAQAQQTQIATAIATQQAADEKRRQEAQQQQFMAALQQTTPVTVEAEPGGELEAPIDPFGRNILVNAEQENLFNNLLGVEPLAAAKGGLIMDPTDEILRILGGR